MKIIIDNQSGMPILTAIDEINAILKRGLVSMEKGYMPVRMVNGQWMINCYKNDKSYRFLVRDL